MHSIKENNKGLTLVEIIIAIALVGIMATVFIPLFTMANKSNSMSTSALESTYSGLDAMELAYNLSRNLPYEDLEGELIKNHNYKKDPSNNSYIYEYDNNNYLNIKFIEEGNLIRVIVNVFEEDKSIKKYESLYTWTGRGILDEG